MNYTDYELYVLAEIKYKKQHPDVNEDELYPSGWYTLDNGLKNEIMLEAISNNILVKDTEKYKETKTLKNGIIKKEC